MATKKKIAKSEAEWWELVREDLKKWNSTNHPEDRLTLLDYVGELSGPIPTYGFRIMLADYTESGYRLVRVQS